MKAAVIVPHFNDVVRLERCLSALLPQMRDDMELVVVDNGSSEDLTPLRCTFPEVRIVTEFLKGAASARNRGVAETTAPLLFFLDCDCVPGPAWVSTALDLAAKADIIGGQISVFDETAPPRTGAQAFEAVFAFDNQRYIHEEGFSVTANLLTRRDVFEAVGPFVVGLSEDMDWCHRARALGYSLQYEDSLRVMHPSRSDWPALTRKWQRLTQEMFGANRLRNGGRIRWAAKALLMPVSALAHTPRVLKHGDLVARERIAAIVTLIRLRLQRMVWMLKQAMLGHI